MDKVDRGHAPLPLLGLRTVLRTPCRCDSCPPNTVSWGQNWSPKERTSAGDNAGSAQGAAGGPLRRSQERHWPTPALHGFTCPPINNKVCSPCVLERTPSQLPEHTGFAPACPKW